MVLEAGSVCCTRRQKGLTFYRSLVDSEFDTLLEFDSAVGIAGMDDVDRNGVTVTQSLWSGECSQAAREQ